MNAKLEKANVFDFLRLFAAFSVLIQHSVGHLGVNFLWLQPGGSMWFYDGVPLFFVLSGMLVYRSYERHVKDSKPLKFYVTNRFLRVAPAVYMYAIITTILLLVIGVISLKTLITVKFIAWFSGNFVLAPIAYPSIFNSFGTGVVNGSLWTIPQEFSFYLFVPIIFIIERKFGFKKMLIFLIAISILGIILLQALNSTVGQSSMLTFLYIHSFLPYMIYFSMGIFWLKCWGKVKSNGFMALLSLLMYFGIRNLSVLDHVLGPYLKLLWIVPLSYSLIWFGYNGPSILHKMVKKTGDLSFGVYIWHMVIINLFMYYNVTKTLAGWPSTLVHVLVIISTFILAALSWRFIERPALKFKPYTSRVGMEDESKRIEDLIVANEYIN